MNLKFFLLTFLTLFLIFVGFFLFFKKNGGNTEIVLNGKTFFVEIADTNALRERGLSGHAPLLDNQGMLFVFPKLGEYGFWMKDMTFSLDIMWMDSNFKIVHIEKEISSDSYPKIFYSKAESQYVLEISAGEADLLKIKIGDIAIFSKK